MKQHDLARQLVSELEAMGAAEITYDKEHHNAVFVGVDENGDKENFYPSAIRA